MKRILCLLLVLFTLSFPALADDDDEYYYWKDFFYSHVEGLHDRSVERATEYYFPESDGYSPRDEWLIMYGVAMGYEDGFDAGYEDGYEDGYHEGYDVCMSDNDLFD